jgi:hypothetical protein
LAGYQIERTRAYNNTNSLMTIIKKGTTYFRLYEDINNEDLIVVKIIPEVNKQIFIINIYFAHEGCRRKKLSVTLTSFSSKSTVNSRALT